EYLARSIEQIKEQDLARQEAALETVRLQSALDTAHKEMVTAQTSYAELEVRFREIEGALDAAQAEAAAAQAGYADMKIRLADSEKVAARSVSLDTELLAISKEAAELRFTVGQQAEELARAGEQLQQYERAGEATKSESAELRAAMQNAHAEMVTAQTRYNELRARVAEMEKIAAATDQQLAEMNAEIERRGAQFEREQAEYVAHTVEQLQEFERERQAAAAEKEQLQS